MKWIFRISLSLNFLILGSFVLRGEMRLRTQDQFAQKFNRQEQQPRSGSSLAHAKAAAVDSSREQTFRWSLLESPNDYRVYVANLRAIGCPEATVKDIVCGDTARAFTQKRRELGLRGDGNGAWSFWRQKKLAAELLGEPVGADSSIGKPATADRPDASETVPSNIPFPTDDSDAHQSAGGAVVSASAMVVSSAGASLAGQRLASRPAAAPVYPLVMQTVNLDALGLTPAQKTAVQTLQQQFINAVGGLDQNPNDPVYLKRWQLAQPQSDFLLKAMLGITAWENYQLLAADSATPTPDPYAALNQ